MLDTVMLRLRMADGLDMTSFALEYGQEAAHAVMGALAPHEQRGHVLRLDRLVPSPQPSSPTPAAPAGSTAGQHSGVHHSTGTGTSTSSSGCNPGSTASNDKAWDVRMRLKDPDGFLLSNDIISDVFSAFSLP